MVLSNYLPSLNLTYHQKMMVSNRNLLFQGAPIFKGYSLVSGRVITALQWKTKLSRLKKLEPKKLFWRGLKSIIFRISNFGWIFLRWTSHGRERYIYGSMDGFRWFLLGFHGSVNIPFGNHGWYGGCIPYTLQHGSQTCSSEANSFFIHVSNLKREDPHKKNGHGHGYLVDFCRKSNGFQWQLWYVRTYADSHIYINT